MMVGCQAGDVYRPTMGSSMLGSVRSRNMSGSSTGSLGSLEHEIPDLVNPLGVSWGCNDMISNFRSGFGSLQQQSGVRMSPQSVCSETSSSDANTCSGQQHQQQQKNIINPTRYKTEMCRPFAETGYCKYGEKCQFAHGTHQLRPMPRHPKYKTELCRTFHTTGICPYGPRCHFVHSEDESKLSEINQMKQQYAQQQAVQELASQAARLQGALGPAAALDSQLKAALIGLGHPLTATHVALTQMSVTNVIAQQQPPQIGMEQFSQWMSMPPPPLLRSDTLGSTGESPPNSAASSPVNTPQFPWSDISEVSTSPSSLPALEPQPEMVSPKIRATALEPLKIPPASSGLSIEAERSPAFIDSLTASFEALSFRSATTATTDEPAIFPSAVAADFDTPPSSPECGSLSSSGRGMRLPVFSKLAAAN